MVDYVSQPLASYTVGNDARQLNDTANIQMICNYANLSNLREPFYFLPVVRRNSAAAPTITPPANIVPTTGSPSIIIHSEHAIEPAISKNANNIQSRFSRKLPRMSRRANCNLLLSYSCRWRCNTMPIMLCLILIGLEFFKSNAVVLSIEFLWRSFRRK